MTVCFGVKTDFWVKGSNSLHKMVHMVHLWVLLYKLRHTIGLREVTLNTKVHLMEERLFILDKTDFWVKGSNSLYKELLLVLEGVVLC